MDDWRDEDGKPRYTGTEPLPAGHEYADHGRFGLAQIVHFMDEGRGWGYMAMNLPQGVKAFTPYGAAWHENAVQGRAGVQHWGHAPIPSHLMGKVNG